MILNSLITGSGAPILLLHGLFGAAKNLGAIARGLGSDAKVIALDLRNHGDSPHGAAMDYAAMAADVAETMQAFDIASAPVIGHSMGGKTAMALALSQPALVQRLVVMDIAPVSYDHAYDDFVSAMQAIPLSPNLSRHAAEAMLQDAVPDAPMRAFLLNNLILGDTPRWRIGLAEISTAMPELTGWADPPGWQPYAGPTLFLRGGNSSYVQPVALPAIMQRFPHAQQETIPDAGHWLHAEQPQAVIAALKEFLRP